MIHEGQVLCSRYRLIRSVGRGSQASVWVAEHLALGSHVAVKLIDPELAKQEDARARFQREASAAAKLRSAHVVQILDHGIDGDQPFIVMELLDGEDLFQRLDRKHHLPLPETSRIVTHVARALMRAHAEGIIHRDLKPENVFIAPNEDEEIVKVLDFGVAKVTTPHKSAMSKTGAGTLIGTPHYMSPEQVKGIGEIDSRSDLWSLAVIAYQTATGILPFDSEGVGDLLIRISMDTPKKPSEVNGELPPEFDAWFAKASAKDPDGRYQTARELADSLAKVAGLEPKPSSRSLPALGSDADWATEFTNPGKAIAVEREVLRISAPTPSGKGLLRAAGPPPEGDIDIVEGSIPPPAMSAEPTSAAPSTPVSPAIPKPPRPPRLESSGPHRTPALAPQRGGATAPIWETSTKASTSDRAGTATLLASSSGISIVPPPELDGSSKRRTLWVVGIAFAIGAVVLAATVIQSQMAASATPAPPAATTEAQLAATNAALPATTQTQEVATHPTVAPTVAPKGPAASASAGDSEVTKKSKPADARPPAAPYPGRVTQGQDGDITIWTPVPDKDAPKR